MAETRQQPRGHEVPLDAAQQRTIAGRRVQRSEVQSFRRAIGKGERPDRRVELAREEGGLDPRRPEPTQSSLSDSASADPSGFRRKIPTRS
jgi:hypothetical protein